MTLDSDLKELEFTGIEMIWDPVKKQRAQKMQEEYGEDLDIIIQYVWQGGGRDLNDYIRGYDVMFKHRQNRNKPVPVKNAEVYKQKVKETMKQVALSDENNFIYCPFTKTRLNNLLKSHEIINAQPDIIQDVFCYIAQGERFKDFKFTETHEKKREEYLRQIQIL